MPSDRRVLAVLPAVALTLAAGAPAALGQRANPPASQRPEAPAASEPAPERAPETAPREWLARLPDAVRAALEQRIGYALAPFPASAEPYTAQGRGGEIPRLTGTGEVVVVQAFDPGDAGSRRSMEALAGALRDREGVRLVAVVPSTARDDRGRDRERRALEAYLGRTELGVPVVYEPQAELARALALDLRTGTNVVADRAGIIRYAGLTPEGVAAAVAALLAEPATEAGAEGERVLPVTMLAERLARSAEVRARLDAALAGGDLLAHADQVMELVGELFTHDQEAGAAAAYALATSNDLAVRPLGLELLRRHATAAQIGQALETMSGTSWIDERRYLTLALAAKVPEDAARVLLSRQRAPDRLERLLVNWAASGLQSPELAAALLTNLNRAPAEVEDWDYGFGELQMMSQYALIEGAAGRPFVDQKEARAFLTAAKAGTAVREELPPLAAWPRTVARIRGFDHILLPSFALRFGGDFNVRATDLVEAVAEGPADVPANLALFTENAVALAQTGWEPVFGRVKPPTLRLILADRRDFYSQGGDQDRVSYSTGNEIWVLAYDADLIGGAIAREYAKVMVNAVFEDLPRWAMEGFADSITASQNGTVFRDRALIEELKIESVIRRGPATRAHGWKGSDLPDDDPTGGQNELYYASHILVDYLRLRFPAPGARLFLLLSGIERGRSSQQLLRALYGQSLGEMDRSIQEWLGY